ncbi:aminomethyl-transferring glycine dehydrogenase subunit GcvPA [bacterium]|nr:aminomethyl-transferring glycine dehydrogenase subunit GcvPA [bacterium]
MAYVPHTDEQLEQMLQEIGVASFEDLIAAIPKDVRLPNGLDIPKGLSEFEVTAMMKEMAAKNRGAVEAVGFLGGGSYDHFIPSAVGAILSRSEWYTAYTPYQPEVSQGTLQAIYEFQSVIANITGMEVANASLYDGPTAMNEAMLLALRVQRKREKVLLSEGVHPHTLKIMRTYADTSGIDLQTVPLKDGRTDMDALSAALGDDTAVLLFSQPNFFGVIEDGRALVKAAQDAGAMASVNAYPVALGMLESPGAYGADLVTGEGQSLGNHMGYGGPYVGLFAAKEKLIRQMPGRISGLTQDVEGRRGFVLALQTREQHIRRGKATSNICTNQGLNALASLIHVALLGKEGFRKVAHLCYHKAHYLHGRMSELNGWTPAFDRPFFNEFVFETPEPAEHIIDKMKDKGFFAGIRLDRFYPEMRNRLLVAVTEKRTRAEMDRFIEELKTL